MPENKPSVPAPSMPAAAPAPEPKVVAAPVVKPAMPAGVAPASPAPSAGPNPSSAPAKESEGLKAAAPQSEAEKNVFTELFGNDKSQKTNSNVMGTVVSQQDKKSTSFFGKKPSLKEVKKPGKKSFSIKKSSSGKLVLQVSILLLVLVGGFFYTQNNANFSLFGVNPAAREAVAQEQVTQLEAEIQVQHHLASILMLDQYSNLADEYFYNLDQAEASTTSQNKKTEYRTAAAEIKPQMITLLESVQSHLSDELSPDALNAAKTVVDELVAELGTKKGEVNEQTLLQDIQDLQSTKRLMQSKAFKNEIARLNLDDVSDEAMRSVFEEYGEVNTSVSALISRIKNDRMDWSVYIEAIEDLTKEVDPLFGTEFASNIQLKDVRFNAEGTISVSGSSLTEDTKNFTLVSNLIDAYEASELFENVEERSYSKSSSNEEAYTGNFRISMTLENHEQ